MLFFIINSIVGFALYTTVKNSNYYAERRWADFYSAKKDSIGLLFLGSSHVYRAFDPSIFDKQLSVNSFNMGNPLQKPSQSYYVLKKVFRTQKPKIVIYDVYWNLFTNEKYFDAKVSIYDCLNIES